MKLSKNLYKKIFYSLWKKSNVLLHAKKNKVMPPSKRYINIIIQGYKDCGYKNTFIVISKNKKIRVK